MKWAIRHVPSGLFYDGFDWVVEADRAALYDHMYTAADAFGQAQAAGRACAPPYELVPMALKYGPVLSSVKL